MASAAGWRWWPDEGVWNPCVDPALPAELAAHALLQTAWAGLDMAAVWDMHVHLIGVGDGDSGIWLNPTMRSGWHPLEFTQFKFYLNAACTADNGDVDRAYVRRLDALIEGFPPGVKFMLLAFDYHYDERGERVEALSPFHTPNDYAARVAASRPERYEWIASIHPYRNDAVEALEWAVSHGARAVKWLPPAQGMDPASPLCDRFYAALARHDLPLLSHVGDEHAVQGGAAQALGNPLRLRRALEQGVRVILAHCATQGRGVDLDRGAAASRVDNFALFARLMDDADYVGRLYGDVSAMTQINRAGPYLKTLLERDDWHGRLLNGSDYPLPGVMPLFSLRALAREEFISEEQAQVCSALRRHNPLLFDFVLKRALRAGGRGFAKEVFATRRVFERIGE